MIRGAMYSASGILYAFCKYNNLVHMLTILSFMVVFIFVYLYRTMDITPTKERSEIKEDHTPTPSSPVADRILTPPVTPTKLFYSPKKTGGRRSRRTNNRKQNKQSKKRSRRRRR